MKTLSVSEFKALAASVPGAAKVKLITLTVPAMNKTDNPFFGRLLKLSHVSGTIGSSYENTVNNQLGREEKPLDFDAQARAYGEHNGKALIEHKGKSYLAISVEHTGKPIFFCDGKQIEKSAVESYLKKSAPPKTQENLDKKVIYRNYTLENILVFKCGEIYLIDTGKTNDEIIAEILAGRIPAELPEESAVTV